MLPTWIQNPEELVTPREKIREGFIEQVQQKGDRANPILEQARIFKARLAGIDSLEKVLETEELMPLLLTAAGLSAKSRAHLGSEDRGSILQETIHPLLSQHPDTWKDELVFRYLLTVGDALGGMMRNQIGTRGATLLIESIRKALQDKNMQVWDRSGTGKVKGLYWSGRCLLFDRKPRFMGKNVDVILLRCTEEPLSERDRLERREDYLACGELKGGIDPAGADEHWKTARSALERIQKCFDQPPPAALFFVGAAITGPMAEELFEWLQRGRLAAAANLTQPQQVEALAAWLVGLP